MLSDISPFEVKERLERKAPGFVLLDCREHDEVAVCAIPGSTHIPMGEIPNRLHDLDRSSEIAVYCHLGSRSQRVVMFLLQQGYRARNMSGGIDRWASDVDPTVPRY